MGRRVTSCAAERPLKIGWPEPGAVVVAQRVGLDAAAAATPSGRKKLCFQHSCLCGCVTDSNRLQTDSKSVALPVELTLLVRRRGLNPLTGHTRTNDQKSGGCAAGRCQQTPKHLSTRHATTHDQAAVRGVAHSGAICLGRRLIYLAPLLSGWTQCQGGPATDRHSQTPSALVYCRVVQNREAEACAESCC